MDADLDAGSKLTPLVVRNQLDEILAREITALLDVDSDFAMVSFNLASISCIILIIEREREIKQSSDSPPERYTSESFITELADIGFEKDETLEKTVASVLAKGYITMDETGKLKAEMPSFMMVGFLDKIFPGMQGINLVAFVLQMNEEVNSGRKSLELAKKSFKASLKSRGVAASKNRGKKTDAEIISGRVVDTARPGKAADKLKKNNLDRLSKIVKRRRKKSFDPPGKLKVKDVFDKGPSKRASDHEKAEQKSAELNRVPAQKEEKIKAAEAAATEVAAKLKEIEQREKKLLAAKKEADEAEQRIAVLNAREAQMLEKESRLKALEETLKQQAKLKQQEKLKHEEEKKKNLEKQAGQQQEKEAEMRNAARADEDIESRIAAFESELAMPCPLCKQGEVTSKTTEKGKVFFLCTKPDCRFVSWDKPCHFECPLCKNPFLTETLLPNGEKGLKCPRASCSYTQKNLYDPKQNMAGIRRVPQKKRRVVRRKRR